MRVSTNASTLKLVWDGPSVNPASLRSSGEVAAPAHWTTITRTHLLLYLALPMLGLVGLTLCVRCYDLDLRISRLFFDVEAGNFPGLDAARWSALYRYGPVPGLVLGIGAITMLAASFLWQRFRKLREPCAFVALVLVLGPGLLVNGLLKPAWDRPRPCELIEFGGTHEFVPVLNLRVTSEHVSKSFPSGHASIGFYLLAPIFVLTRSSRRWSIAFLVLGLSLGFAMGLGRVAQGRHFPSDVLWSGAIVYFTGLLLAYVMHPATSALPSLASHDGAMTAEPSVLRLDEYRQPVDREIDTSDAADRDASKRRAA